VFSPNERRAAYDPAVSTTSAAKLPLPPAKLASRVFAVEGWSDPDLAFEELGAQTKRQVVSLLPPGWSMDGKRILDFGCGAGRTLRHFAAEADTAEIWGCDIDGPSIDWLQKNLCPPFHAWQSTYNPPLGLEHGSFDLIYAISVFTHLTDNSVPWLLELRRMLKPDGLLIATFMGRWISEWFAKEEWVEDRVGMNVLHHDRGWDSGGPAVLISEWWLREHWGRAFEIVSIAPQFQNFGWAVLRKREVELTTDDVLRPADDPREYVALRHNIRQLQREFVEELRYREMHTQLAVKEQAAAHERQLSDATRRLQEYEARIQEYETSLSWKTTQPLRWVNRELRARRGR
jgi:SAM-dependent methyltransferase